MDLNVGGFCGLLENNWDLKAALKLILKTSLFLLSW